MTATTTRWAGADWLRKALGPQAVISPLGERVADLLGELWRGLYHHQGCARVDWANPSMIRVTCYGNDLATHDFNGLTRLVFLAHRERIRVQVTPCNFHRIALLFHDRAEPNWHGTHPHPTLAEAVAAFEREGQP